MAGRGVGGCGRACAGQGLHHGRSHRVHPSMLGLPLEVWFHLTLVVRTSLVRIARRRLDHAQQAPDDLFMAAASSRSAAPRKARDRSAFAGAVQGNPSWLACMATLRQLAATSIGPLGYSHVIQANASSAVTVTSISHRLFDQLRIEHPAARAVLQLLQLRQAKGADGGLLTVLMATSLVLGVSHRRLPARLVSSLLPSVLHGCLKSVLNDAERAGQGAAAVPLRLSDLPSLLALVRTVLVPKHIALPGGTIKHAEHLALLTVTAFVRSLPESPDASGGDPAEAAEARAAHGASAARAALSMPGVRTLSVVGPHLRQSELLDGVLLDTPFPSCAPLPAEAGETGLDLIVALYNVSLEGVRPDGLDAKVTLTFNQTERGPTDREEEEEEGEGEGEGELDEEREGERYVGDDDEEEQQHLHSQGGYGDYGADASSNGSMVSGEAEALLVRFADGIASAGVRVLCCQQRVAPALIRLLLERGVLPLPRISLRHIGAVRRLSGATPLSILEPPSAADLGRLAAVRRRAIGQKEYTHLLPPTEPAPPPAVSQPVVTLVLCAPNRSASEELAAAVACALSTLGAALAQRRPRLVPGAGSFETLMAAELRRRAALPSRDDERSMQLDDAKRTSSQALERLRRATCALLAHAFEDVVVALSGPDGLRGREAAEQLMEANAIAATPSFLRARGGERSFYGWDVDAQRPCDVLTVVQEAPADDASSGSSSDEDEDAGQQTARSKGKLGPLRVEWPGVVELESEKLEAISGAIEVACSVMSVDQIVVDTR